MTADRLARATPDNFMFPPDGGWTYDQVKDLELPYEWELVDGTIVVRGMTHFWHDRVRNRLALALSKGERPPFTSDAERCVMVDDQTVVKPDIVVYDKTGLDVFTMECLPVRNVRLAVEVVSPGSQADDRYRKPGLLAEAGVPHFWRVERGEDGLPVVHEFWRHHEAGTFAPPDRPTHRRRLKTDVPFPVDIDLAELVEL
jgi:Uma2 family endonuclease